MTTDTNLLGFNNRLNRTAPGRLVGTPWLIAVGVLVAAATPGERWAAASPLEPAAATAALKTPQGIAARLFASEPMLTNPSNIDIDHRGRVWVCDVMNYRGNQGSRPDGDRILILEDEDGDGRADSSKVFYQGPDVDSAIGICVLPGDPLRVVVSCSPNVWLFTDADGDDLPDSKKAIYTNTGRQQHDHSAHAFVFGPDGLFYWNVGNTHEGVHDADGNLIVDRFGRPVAPNGRPYRDGMAFRSTLDGQQFDVLAHNQRNSYELTVDSFGGVWFSDNDDDGNRGTRIGMVLEGGNYGYRDEMTGASWQVERIGMSDNVSERHWHQNDPGSIPNLANLGNGSPAGITLYEGSLVPGLRGRLVHCEPGLSLVRAISLHPDGGGRHATVAALVESNDPWFRPVDAAVGPDGSVFVADWYDPGVGGHRQGDLERGRIYRIAPTGHSGYAPPQVDLTPDPNAIAALVNPCQSVRYLGWQTLAERGEAAAGLLAELSASYDPIDRARAYWLLARLPGAGPAHIQKAAGDAHEDVRAAAIRMARRRGSYPLLMNLLKKLASDPSGQVRRACAIALRDVAHTADDVRPIAAPRPAAPRRGPDEATLLWRKMVGQYESGDRWMLEALGLAADGRWEHFFAKNLASSMLTTLNTAGDRMASRPAARDIVWRSRGESTLQLLTALLVNPSTPQDEFPRLLRALDFQTGDGKDAALTGLLEAAQDLPKEQRQLITTKALDALEQRPLNRTARAALLQLLEDSPRNEQFMQYVQQFEVDQRYPELLMLAVNEFRDASAGVAAIRFLLDQGFVDAIETRLQYSGDIQATMIRMLANTGHPAASRLLEPLALDEKANLDLRREAIRAAAAKRESAARLVEAAEQDKLDRLAKTALAYALRGSTWDELSRRAAKLCPDLPADHDESLPVSEWMQLAGDPRRGERLFFSKAECGTCHQVGSRGVNVGPPLSEVGGKLSRAGLFEAILYPSAAISHNYEMYAALTSDGVSIKGLLISETDESVTLKTEKNVVHELPRADLESFEKQDVSLMPAGVHRKLSAQEIADLAAYLAELRKK